jgi:TrpR-related protein YerC/YecD
MKRLEQDSLNNLYNAILKIKDVDECENFLNDICTIQELEAIAQRFDVAQKLIEGKVYTEISKETGASTATVCRVNRCIKYGNGGYKTVIDRMMNEEK